MPVPTNSPSPDPALFSPSDDLLAPLDFGIYSDRLAASRDAALRAGDDRAGVASAVAFQREKISSLLSFLARMDLSASLNPREVLQTLCAICDDPRWEDPSYLYRGRFSDQVCRELQGIQQQREAAIVRVLSTGLTNNSSLLTEYLAVADEAQYAAVARARSVLKNNPFVGVHPTGSQFACYVESVISDYVSSNARNRQSEILSAFTKTLARIEGRILEAIRAAQGSGSDELLDFYDEEGRVVAAMDCFMGIGYYLPETNKALSEALFSFVRSILEFSLADDGAQSEVESFVASPLTKPHALLWRIEHVHGIVQSIAVHFPEWSTKGFNLMLAKALDSESSFAEALTAAIFVFRFARDGDEFDLLEPTWARAACALKEPPLLLMLSYFHHDNLEGLEKDDPTGSFRAGLQCIRRLRPSPQIVEAVDSLLQRFQSNDRSS